MGFRTGNDEEVCERLCKAKAEYESRNLLPSDLESLSKAERKEYLDKREEAIDNDYENTLYREDSKFYKSIQEGPEGCSREENSKIFRNIFWDYLTTVGWYISAIAGYAENSEASLKAAIEK